MYKGLTMTYYKVNAYYNIIKMAFWHIQLLKVFSFLNDQIQIRLLMILFSIS